MDRAYVDQLTRQFYIERLTNDPARVFPLLAPDISITLSGDAAASDFPRACCEPAEVQTLVNTMLNLWRFDSEEIKKLVIDGPTAAAYLRVHATFTPTGAAIATEAVDLLTFENGLVREFIEFADTAKLQKIQRAVS